VEREIRMLFRPTMLRYPEESQPPELAVSTLKTWEDKHSAFLAIRETPLFCRSSATKKKKKKKKKCFYTFIDVRNRNVHECLDIQSNNINLVSIVTNEGRFPQESNTHELAVQGVD
jgi:hypothetical protein